MGAFDVGSTVVVPRLKVDRLLDGCVLREEYAGSEGHKGESLSIYDASRKVWHQTWVMNRGELLVIEVALKIERWFSLARTAPRMGEKDEFMGSGNLKAPGFVRRRSPQPMAAKPQ